MSETRVDSDWWLASDGKWYPPESVPSPPLPPASKPSTDAGAGRVTIAYAAPSSHGVSSTLSTWLKTLMCVGSVGSAATSVLQFAALDSFNAFLKSFGPAETSARFDRWDGWDRGATLVGHAFLLLWIVTFVVLVVWMFQAHKATQLLWTGRRRWRIGWTLGGWFVPLAQFVIPKLVLNEIERIAMARRSTTVLSAPAHPTRIMTSGWVWWVLLSVGLLAGGAVRRQVASPDRTINEVRAAYIAAGFGFACVSLGLACGAFYLSRISRRLSASGLTLVP